MEEWTDLMLWKQMHRDYTKKDQVRKNKRCPFHHMVQRRVLRVQHVIDFFQSFIREK